MLLLEAIVVLCQRAVIQRVFQELEAVCSPQDQKKKNEIQEGNERLWTERKTTLLGQ